MSIKDIAEEYAKAWKNAIVNGDITSFETLFDSKFVLHNKSSKDIGLETYRQHVVDMYEHCQVINIDIKYVTSDRYLFALDFNGHFRLTSDMPGYPGTAGKEIKSQALCLYRVKNSKVIEVWSKTTVTGLV